MYDFSDLVEGLRNPRLILREFNRLYHRRLGRRPYNVRGVDVFEGDWDTLILLDACRYDTFRQRADLPGELDKAVSRGAATPEFVRANFKGKDLLDTVYVTRNTWFLKLEDGLDCNIHALYHLTDPSPEPITELALEAAEEHPNKRLIVHYLPPHHPFVGPTADESFPPYEEQSNDLFWRIQQGELEVSDGSLRNAYRENLDRVLPEVQRLLDELDGRTVVTSDHGELLGDRAAPIPMKEYGHHAGLYVSELVTVPWLVHEGDSRRRIVAEPPVDDDRDDLLDESINDQLRDLGYRV